MKKIGLAFLAWVGICGIAHGQFINFNNRISGVVDARVVLPDGSGAGTGWTAQLFLQAPSGELTPLSNKTTFRTVPAAAMGYVNPGFVIVPGFSPGDEVTVLMRAYNGSSFETSTMRYQSDTITVVLGTASSMGNLVGLQPPKLVPAGTAPVIMVNPKGQTLEAGATVTLTVQATGTEPITYQWQKNGVAIPGATSSTYALSNVTDAEAGSYTVVVLNPAGSATSQAAILSLPARGQAQSVQHPQYVPGEAMPIEIEVVPSAQVSTYGAQDQAPAGWVASQISHGGEFDAVKGSIKWGPFLDTRARVLSYQVLAPTGATQPVEFVGFASFDGANAPVRGARRAVASNRLKRLSIGADGKFNLEVSGHKGTKLRVEGSTDLRVWARIDAVVNPDVAISFNDTATGASGPRFYRVIVE